MTEFPHGGAASIYADLVGGVVNTPALYKIRDYMAVFEAAIAGLTVILVAAGQSNIASTNAAAAGGTLVNDDRIRLWNGAAWVTWDIEGGAGVGAVGYNSIAFQIARAAVAAGAPQVFVIVKGEPGETIDQWTGSGASSSNYVTLKGLVDNAMAAAEITGLGATQITHFLWGQGESDGGPTWDLGTYQASFETLKSQLRAETWFAADTPIVCLEMPPQGAASVANQYFLDTLPIDDDPWTQTVRLTGLATGSGDLHWTGAAMDIIGARAWAQFQTGILTAKRGPWRLEAGVLRLALEEVYGKGPAWYYGDTNDQIIEGVASNNVPGAVSNPKVTIDINDNWRRFESLVYFAARAECQGALRPKHYTSGAFTNAAHAINTDKLEGDCFRDTTSNKVLFAGGSAATDPWVDALGATVYTPA